MRAVSWHACLRKASWKGGVVTGIYRPPGIADTLAVYGMREMAEMLRENEDNDGLLIISYALQMPPVAKNPRWLKNP